jgi:AcrR family transcriptional regulator
MEPGDRRDAILQAAVEAFAAAPYAEVKISDIAEAVGASSALVYKYFANKEDLYLAVIAAAQADLADRTAAAVEALHRHTPVHAKVAALLSAYLDHVAANPQLWALPRRQPGSEPAAAAALRQSAEADFLAQLRALLAPRAARRHEYALRGFFGFVEAAALYWVGQGAPERDRHPLIAAAQGCLEGALGDWAA